MINKKRKKLLLKIKKQDHVFATCRYDKHLWRNSNTQANMRVCRCCGSLEFR